MTDFLHLLPPQQALELWLANLPPFSPRVEQIPLLQSLGHITAEELLAPAPLPAFPRSTVDGYAVHARDTFGASESLPAYLQLTGEIPMGKAVEESLADRSAVLIHTGGMLPPGADAVVMIEYTQITGTGEVEILRPAAPLENILGIGEDVQPGQKVISSGKRIRPEEIGGFSAFGIQTIPCFAQPRVGILSSGDEVIPPHQQPLPGQVRDINTFSLSALVEQNGGLPMQYDILPDVEAIFHEKLRQVLAQSDFVIITAGSSASTRDLTARVIQQMGPPGVLVHGVNIKPGKPTILAVCNGKPLIGLPGNPVSALVIARLFALPILRYLSGWQEPVILPSIPARITINLSSQAGREDWIPVKLVSSPRGMLAEPIFYKSNLIFSLVQADGLIRIHPDSNGLPADEPVEVMLL